MKIKLLNWLYPSEARRYAEISKEYQKLLEEEQRIFRADILMSMGFGLFSKLVKRSSNEQVISLVSALYEKNNEVISAAKKEGIDENEIINTLSSHTMAAELAEKYKKMARSAVEKKKALVIERKKELKEKKAEAKRNLEIQLEEWDRELEKLNEDHTETAKEETEIKETISHDEEK